jgi:hypothetical protein
MDTMGNSRGTNALARQLASLKLLSRLLGHELHAQGSSKSVTLSREEVSEMQVTLDLFIEEVSRRMGGGGSLSSGAQETQLVTARNN